MTEEDKSRKISFPLRMPRSLGQAAKRMAEEEGISLNRFIGQAVEDRLTQLRVANRLPASGSEAAQHITDQPSQ
jgi:hypothetical protein